MPLMMVIINDIMAYMFGFFMGRTPLIKISPKKTWEGFIGGGISTVFMSLGLAYVMCQVSWPLQMQVYRDDTGFFGLVSLLRLPHRVRTGPGEDDHEL